MKKSKHERYMLRAIELARQSMDSNTGGPFGAVIVKDGKVVGEGSNSVTSHNDPTAHAEINAIRHACLNLNSFQLNGCQIYCTCEPCPMCLGAIYWARIDKVFIASKQDNAANAGFDDSFIYNELSLNPENRSIKIDQLLEKEGEQLFQNWINKKDKLPY